MNKRTLMKKINILTAFSIALVLGMSIPAFAIEAAEDLLLEDEMEAEDQTHDEASANNQSEKKVDLTDIVLKIDGESYNFPMRVSELSRGKWTVKVPESFQENIYYTQVSVSDEDGRFFYITVEQIGDELWATGVSVDDTHLPGAELSGVIPGQTSMSVLETQFENENVTILRSEADKSLSVTTFADAYEWQFVPTSSDATEALMTSYVKEVYAHSNIPYIYGVGFISNGISGAAAADVSTLSSESFILDGVFYEMGITVQDMLDAGWRLPNSSPSSMQLAPADEYAYGDSFLMYNGANYVYVEAYNYSDETVPLNECNVSKVAVVAQYGSTLIAYRGLTLGSTQDEFNALFGEEDAVTDGLYTYKIPMGFAFRAKFEDGVAVYFELDDID